MAGALDGGVGAGGVDDGAFADDVVAENDAARAGELEGEAEVVGIVGLVGVDKDEVEGSCGFAVELGEGVEGGGETELDEVGEAGVAEVGLGDFGVFGVGLESDELAVGGQSAWASQMVL